MKLLIARITKGQVAVAEEAIGSVSKGIALFVGIAKGDTQAILKEMAEKVINLRIFEDEAGKLAYSLKDKGYSVLCIPNFTLCARTDSGRRPSFDDSLPYAEAEEMFDDFVLVLKSYGVTVEAGLFGAYMDIGLQLNGPVNIILDSNK